VGEEIWVGLVQAGSKRFFLLMRSTKQSMYHIITYIYLLKFIFQFYYLFSFPRYRYGNSNDVTTKAISPKHMPVPNLPHDSNVIFEILMFIFTAMATFLQFLHLYRSVWWLPQSYTKYAMVILYFYVITHVWCFDFSNTKILLPEFLSHRPIPCRIHCNYTYSEIGL
jgi:hypothetical protein